MKRILITLALLGITSCGGSAPGDGSVGDTAAAECSGNEDCSEGADTISEDSVPEDSVLEDTLPGVDSVPGVDTPPAPDGPPGVPAADILVDPMEHMFTFVPGVPNPETTTVIIYNQGTGALKIDSIEWADGSSPEFTFMAKPPLPATVHPYDHTAVSVIFKEQAPHGPADLVIKSNDPDSPEVVVHFTSQAKTGDMPCIQLQPSTLNFGQVVRGTTKTLPFTVINCSTSTVLQISDVERSSFFGMQLTDEFQMVPAFPTPTMLGANQTADWEMSYSPGLAGLDNGYFLFHSNDLAQPEAKLNVSGIGVPPPIEEIGLHIELEWDEDNCDVDLHLLQPGGSFFDCSDCYFSNPSPDWGTQGDVNDDPFLDYDDIDGYGPENINITEPQPGVYKILIHYYSDTYDYGPDEGATDAIVRVYSYGQLLAEFGPQELDQTDRNWDVCNFEWPSATTTPLGATYMVGSGDKGSCLPFF